MFEKTLHDKFKRIFDMKKATYDQISDSNEQECLFIEVLSSPFNFKDGKALARVQGKITVFGNADRFPFGYFSKRIAEAEPADVRDLFFYDLEGSSGKIVNIDQRTLSFVYLFEAQYDPNVGTLNELQIEVG